MADGVWKCVQSQVIERSDQLSLNKFFDPNTPCSMRKVDEEEKNKAFVGLGSCDNVQTEWSIFEYANWFEYANLSV